jgi:photosynthetic reaction center cytochrome c subunit
MNGLNGVLLTSAAAIAVVATTAVAFLTFERPPVETIQRGFRGTGMEHVENPRAKLEKVALNQVPAPQDPVENGGTPSSEVYQNVQVLGDVDSEQFLRLMNAITEWVSPEQGCTYCHAEGEDLSADTLYTKIVSRRMLAMTRHINADWQAHVGNTGVTCYTCHRGKPVPSEIWFRDPGRRNPGGLAGDPAGQNGPGAEVGLASLPSDPYTAFLGANPAQIRVNGPTDLPTGNRSSIKQAEWTYGLMIHMSESLGVNCTYCHNTRSFQSWEQSSPARSNAWYGIRMVQDLNQNYLEPLGVEYPHPRLGPLGDAPKVNCGTCHLGVFKPLYGASMLKDYPELGVTGAPAPSASAAGVR